MGKRKKTDNGNKEKRKGRDKVILRTERVDKYGHLIHTCDR